MITQSRWTFQHYRQPNLSTNFNLLKFSDMSNTAYKKNETFKSPSSLENEKVGGAKEYIENLLNQLTVTNISNKCIEKQLKDIWKSEDKSDYSFWDERIQLDIGIKNLFDIYCSMDDSQELSILCNELGQKCKGSKLGKDSNVYGKLVDRLETCKDYCCEPNQDCCGKQFALMTLESLRLDTSANKGLCQVTKDKTCVFSKESQEVVEFERLEAYGNYSCEQNKVRCDKQLALMTFENLSLDILANMGICKVTEDDVCVYCKESQEVAEQCADMVVTDIEEMFTQDHYSKLSQMHKLFLKSDGCSRSLEDVETNVGATEKLSHYLKDSKF